MGFTVKSQKVARGLGVIKRFKTPHPHAPEIGIAALHGFGVGRQPQALEVVHLLKRRLLVCGRDNLNVVAAGLGGRNPVGTGNRLFAGRGLCGLCALRGLCVGFLGGLYGFRLFGSRLTGLLLAHNPRLTHGLLVVFRRGCRRFRARREACGSRHGVGARKRLRRGIHRGLRSRRLPQILCGFFGLTDFHNRRGLHIFQGRNKRFGSTVGVGIVGLKKRGRGNQKSKHKSGKPQNAAFVSDTLHTLFLRFVS